MKATPNVAVAISVCAATTNKFRCNEARSSCTTSQIKATEIVVRTAVTSAVNHLDLMATVGHWFPSSNSSTIITITANHHQLSSQNQSGGGTHDLLAISYALNSPHIKQRHPSLNQFDADHNRIRFPSTWFLKGRRISAPIATADNEDETSSRTFKGIRRKKRRTWLHSVWWMVSAFLWPAGLCWSSNGVLSFNRDPLCHSRNAERVCKMTKKMGKKGND